METKKRMSKAQIEKVCNQLMEELTGMSLDERFKEAGYLLDHYRDKLSLVKCFLIDNYKK
jgi:hypothetical protein